MLTGNGLLDSLLWAIVFLASSFGLHVAGRLRMRARMTEAMSRRQPHQRDEIAALMRRSIPLVGRIGLATGAPPSDPYTMTTTVVVPPLGDGRPGERFESPGPNVSPDSPLGWGRQDAQVVLGAGARLLVVCLGRVGRIGPGHVLGPAQLRCDAARRGLDGGRRTIGPVLAIRTPAGPAWRHTLTVGASKTVTDTHVDRGGWAFVIGVVADASDPHLLGVADAVLATWAWVDDTGAPAPYDVDWTTLPVDPLGTGCTVAVGRDEAPVAAFRAPGPRMPLVPFVDPDGGRGEAHVRLTATADLLVRSGPVGGGAAERLSRSARPGLQDLEHQPAGPVLQAMTAAGPAVRRRFVQGVGVVQHEVHVDHGDRGWTLWLLHGPDEEHLVGVLDQALATWRWLDEPVAGAATGGARP